ncbi:MAG: hypothetical protein J5973_02740 [Eubacterium sp.]|nr:hypothetical protein [Eubacterium sp.]
MIVYCDLHRRPIFEKLFEESGVLHQNHYRSVWRMLLAQKYGRKIPDWVLYPQPVLKEDKETVIVFDTHTTLRYLQWLHRKAPDARIILWFWNPVGQGKMLEWLPPYVEAWTYSLADSEAFRLHHNTQFFFDCLAEEAEDARKRAEENKGARPLKAAFVGRDKERSGALYALAAQLREAGVEVETKIVPPARKEPRVLYEDLMSYRQIIDRAKEADILLDYSTDPEAGLSLRPMEALFFGKKLITNAREILQADFYHPSNIYVLGEDKRKLQEFLSCPVEAVPDEIRDRYLLSAWMKRFSE